MWTGRSGSGGLGDREVLEMDLLHAECRVGDGGRVTNSREKLEPHGRFLHTTLFRRGGVDHLRLQHHAHVVGAARVGAPGDLVTLQNHLVLLSVGALGAETVSALSHYTYYGTKHCINQLFVARSTI